MSLILASKSRARQEMLNNAGVSYEAMPAHIDEEKIIEQLQETGASSSNIALQLAKEKAIEISKTNEGKYIIGSDQVLSMDDIIYSKAKNVEEAKERLSVFQGKEHFLTSAVCVVKDGVDLWHKVDAASLKMKPLSSQDIEKYSKIAGDDLIECVGCYALEGAGIRLFADIRGDFFTILGMPLLPLLNFLDKETLL